jgi:hypothetical protein
MMPENRDRKMSHGYHTIDRAHSVETRDRRTGTVVRTTVIANEYSCEATVRDRCGEIVAQECAPTPIGAARKALRVARESNFLRIEAAL